MSNENQAKYTKYMFESINELVPNLSESIDKVVNLPASIGVKILSIIISYACQSQNTAIITIAHKEFKKIPIDWVKVHIIEAIEIGINLEDDWDYRRLLELLFESVSEFRDTLSFYINKGKLSSNPEICEAAEDFNEKLIDA